MRVVISAGGTGGHIYPALSIAEKLREKDNSVQILYIGTTDRMERDIVPLHNIEYYGLKVRGFDRKLSFNNFKTIKYFINAVKDVKRLLKEFKPDIVIGVGGYVTAPVIYAAHKCKIKTIIHEQNSVLGMTNKFLSRYTDAVAISFKDTKVKNKCVVYTGNPSSEVETNLSFDKREFGLHDNKKLVLIVMGSLGSKAVNLKMKEILPNFNTKDYEVMFVTGKNYYDEFKTLKLNNNVVVVPYINDMKRLFKKTDVLISRAGATTISEIVSYNVPSILIPSPYVTDNHQYKNALSLVDNNSALLIEEKDLNSDIIIKSIDKLLYDSNTCNNIKKNLSLMYVPNAATKMYELIDKVVNRR